MSNRQKECVQMPGKMARSDPRLSVPVTRGAGSGHTSRLSCKRAGKTRTLMPVWDSSGESRFKGTAQQETGDNQSGSCLAQLRGIFGATPAGEMVAARGIIVGEHSGHESGQALATNGEKHEYRDCR